VASCFALVSHILGQFPFRVTNSGASTSRIGLLGLLY
jgi:hypothetical protein